MKKSLFLKQLVVLKGYLMDFMNFFFTIITIIIFVPVDFYFNHKTTINIAILILLFILFGKHIINFLQYLIGLYTEASTEGKLSFWGIIISVVLGTILTKNFSS